LLLSLSFGNRSIDPLFNVLDEVSCCTLKKLSIHQAAGDR
jgi:hypothetical protein